MFGHMPSTVQAVLSHFFVFIETHDKVPSHAWYKHLDSGFILAGETLSSQIHSTYKGFYMKMFNHLHSFEAFTTALIVQSILTFHAKLEQLAENKKILWKAYFSVFLCFKAKEP